MPALPPETKRQIQPLDVRRRREIKVWAEINRILAENNVYVPQKVKNQMAKEIVGRLELERELS